jgi:hypothetical protein
MLDVRPMELFLIVSVVSNVMQVLMGKNHSCPHNKTKFSSVR